MLMEGIADRSERVGVAALLGLTGVACAWMFAYWFWQIPFRPVVLSTSLTESNPEQLVQEVRARQMFGAPGAFAGSVSTLIGTNNMVLAGIVSSASDKRGVAVIVLDGKKPVTARVGQEIAPDLILSRVATDHVELTQRGQTISLRLSTKK